MNTIVSECTISSISSVHSSAVLSPSPSLLQKAINDVMSAGWAVFKGALKAACSEVVTHLFDLWEKGKKKKEAEALAWVPAEYKTKWSDDSWGCYAVTVDGRRLRPLHCFNTYNNIRLAALGVLSALTVTLWGAVKETVLCFYVSGILSLSNWFC